jgi:putative ABC transport system permease protein
LRDRAATILVAGLSATFGVGLLQVTGFLTAAISGDAEVGSRAATGILLALAAIVFIVIALYVGAVVTANTVATVVAGRVRTIALLRLLGATARAHRIAIARDSLLDGAVGALAGGVAGTALAIGLERLAIAADWFPATGYGYTDPVAFAPLVAVTLTTWLAAWVGSRRVLTVTPLEALGSSTGSSADDIRSRPRRTAAAVVLGVVGLVLLGLGIVVGLVTPLGVLIGLVGGVLSFSGLVAMSDALLPSALRLVGRVTGRGAPGRLAAENAVRNPERSARATIGLVIGVTLVTTLSVAAACFLRMVEAAQRAQPETYQGMTELVNGVVAVFAVLVGFSGIIAAVGLVNTLSVSVLQRTRELGLLRALGFSVAQLRAMILAEGAQLVVTALLVGVLLGTGYGWAGAQSMLGWVSGSPGIVAPAVPWPVLGILLAVGTVLTAIATWAPARRAARVSPVAALAVE